MECVNREEEQHRPSFAGNALRKARGAGRVVISQEHLCAGPSDQPCTERLVDPINACVVEHAANLIHAARSAQSRVLEVDALKRRLQTLLDNCHGCPAGIVDAVRSAASQTSELLESCRTMMRSYRESRSRESANPVAVDQESWNQDVFGELGDMLPVSADVFERASKAIESESDASREHVVIARQLAEAAETIRLFRQTPQGWAASIEGAPARNPKRLSLSVVPIEVGSVVQRIMDEAKGGVIAHDRHLRYQGSFERIRSAWGLATEAHVIERVLSDESLVMPRLFLPEDITPPVTRTGRRYHWEKYMERTANLLRMIAEVLGGRTIAAFSAHHELRRVRDILGIDPPKDCIVLAQYQDGTKSALVKEYISNQATLLLGGRNFLDGVDLRPAGFTALVLVKLPFVSPEEPLHRAALRSYEAQGIDGLEAYLVPLAVETSNRWIDSLIAGPIPDGVDASRPPGAVILLDPRAVISDWGNEYVTGLNASPDHRLPFRDMLVSLGEMVG